LKPVLAATYGVILYQEQVMQIAQVLAGYTLGGADLLRRAMGKKKAEEMAKQRSVFVSGAVARGVPEAQATRIFDLMEKFAGYGFNKSHSAAYALAVLSNGLAQGALSGRLHGGGAVLGHGQDRQGGYADRRMRQHEAQRAAARRERVRVRVSRSRVPMSIRYGMGAIKGVGASAVEAIIEERTANGRSRA
jgi:DNA polymerase-3 subunit alpha